MTRLLSPTMLGFRQTAAQARLVSDQYVFGLNSRHVSEQQKHVRYCTSTLPSTYQKEHGSKDTEAVFGRLW
jgi:hypothetical protein